MLAALFLEAYILFRMSVNISLALFGEGTPSFTKSHFSLEEKKI